MAGKDPSKPSIGYQNPVIPGFFPDPSVCRVGDDYFLVTSSFTFFPGVPIFHSTNLVDWTQIGNVLERRSQLDLEETRTAVATLGVCAPTIRHHDGRFWVITTIVTTNGAPNIIVTADDPAGPWSEPIYVDLPGIDPDLAWDDAGNCWVHYSGIDGITRCRIDESTGELLTDREPTWSGVGLQYPEAPHLLEHEGGWYLLIAEGGTERGHAVSIARGPTPEGPWESCPANPILSHRSSNKPIQNIGHSDLVQAADGSWWLVALGVRPRGVTPGFHVLGRETFLAPVHWMGGWPVIEDVEPEMYSTPPGERQKRSVSARDDFDAAELASTWVTLRRPREEFASLGDRAGWVTLHGGEATLDDPFPALLGRRQQHHSCRARALVDASGEVEAGITVFMDDRHHYEVGVVGDRIVANARIGSLATVVASVPRPPGSVVLEIETVPDVEDPDLVRFSYEADGEVVVLAELAGRYLSTEVVGGFTGRILGMYAVGGDAAFDWFGYEPETS